LDLSFFILFDLFFMIKNNHTLHKIIIFSGSLKKSINAFCAAGIKQSTFHLARYHEEKYILS